MMLLAVGHAATKSSTMISTGGSVNLCALYSRSASVVAAPELSRLRSSPKSLRSLTEATSLNAMRAPIPEWYVRLPVLFDLSFAGFVWNACSDGGERLF